MLKKLLVSSLLLTCCFQERVTAHCQMPCGIYHDDMVFDQIDQFIETTVKCISILTDNKFTSLQDRNEFVRWIIQKENSSNEVANILTTYFLQQKIKPDDTDTAERLKSVHHLLFLLVKIKQTAELDVISDFYEEWEKFKLMFHIEGYECKMEQKKLKNWIEKKRQDAAIINKQQAGKPTLSNQADNHYHDDHDHDHDHDHDDHDHTH